MNILHSVEEWVGEKFFYVVNGCFIVVSEGFEGVKIAVDAATETEVCYGKQHVFYVYLCLPQ
ncbi:hypothetical protein ES703_100721 [subsurface metagenome]